MESTPKVSLLVPVYGVEEYIEKCARSLFEQTWQNLEYIFINDGTPDRSIEIVRELLRDEYQSRAPLVTIIDQEHCGISRTRLNAVACASGDYILFVDPDDWVELDFAESLVRSAIDNGADIASCNYIFEYSCGKSKCGNKRFSGGDGIEMIRQMYHGSIHGYLCNKLIKRELWNNERLCCSPYPLTEDMFFLAIIAGDAKKVVWVDKALYHYRRGRKGAITNSSWIKTRTSIGINMLEAHKITLGMKSTEAAQTDMVMKGAWYCISSFHFRKLMDYQHAIRYILDVPLSPACRVAMGKQRFVKLWCRLVVRVVGLEPTRTGH